MRYPLFAAMLALSVTFPSLADVLTIKKDAPKQYVVKKGDTLWDISGVYLEQPWQWPELWQMNPQINNPHLIYPGDALSLIYDEHGNPRLVVILAIKSFLHMVVLHQKVKMRCRRCHLNYYVLT